MPLSDVLLCLRCPTCGGALEVGPEQAACAGCGRVYAGSVGGPVPLDLRPQEPLRVAFEVEVGTPGPDEWPTAPPPLTANDRPFDGVRDLPASGHTSAELISWIPEPSRPGALALDLGCGSGDSRAALEAAGYTYVGVDYGHPDAMVFVDGHVLPFDDGAFDLVMSVAVLEHLHTPARAMAEVRRVLVPGRTFLGTVAFLEPYHQRSYYHHTSLGTLQSLRAGGLEVVQLWSPGPGWDVFDAQAKVLFKGMPPLLRRAARWSAAAAHPPWWWVGRRSGRPGFGADERLATTAGSWAFLARAPER